MKKGVLLILLILLCCMAGGLRAQTGTFPAGQGYVRPDTLLAGQGTLVDTLPEREPPPTVRPYHGNHALQPVTTTGVFSNASLVFLPDSLIRDSLHYEYTKIKEFAYRRKLTRAIYKMLFINRPSGRLEVMNTQNSEERFASHAGKTIASIRVEVLPPYGTSVFDTSGVVRDDIWWKKVINKTHFSTSERLIKRQLTFGEGSTVAPFELVQNEILLRDLDYIDDVTIELVPSSTAPNAVDVFILCKDELSWGGSIETNFLNSFSLGAGNKNFFKFGHIINYKLSYRGTEDKKWGNLLEYETNSILGTHINARGMYRNDHREKQVRVEVDRPFLTTRMKWAGGIAAGRVFYSDDLPDRNMSRLENLFDYHFQDVWAGYSFRLPHRHSYYRNLYLAGRFFTTIFHRRPVVSNDTNHLYYNRMDAFGALVYTKIKYYKANLIYDFGRTEDIPTGLYLGFTGGYEWSEYDDYAYVAGEMRYSHFNPYSERYYALHAAIGSYVYKRGFERGMLEAGGSHISNLLSVGKLRYRFYNDVRYIRGIRRYPADHLYMEDRDIRGFSSDTLCGNQKLAISLAATAFLPFINHGFRTSVTAFVDAGLLAPARLRLFQCRPYWGFGVSLNLRNDNLIIKNISLRLSFYPVVPPDGRWVHGMMSDGIRGKFYDYRVTKPQPLLYE